MLGPLLAAVVLTSGPRVEAFAGASLSAPGQLVLALDREAPAVQAASWDNAPFTLPPYWLVRAGWDFGRLEASLELAHHKLRLVNPRPPLDRFEISHGFNLALATLAWKLQPALVARGGLGLVVTHPESSVRGVAFGDTGPDEGFLLSGAAGTLGLERRFALWRWFSLILATAGTVAWVRVPVAGGHADVTDVALHLRLGLGAGPP